jgi:hypothetical protein
MHIREISFTLATPVCAASAHFEIDGTEYLITAGKETVNVYAGRWIHDRRGVGKTFQSPEQLAGHYKKHGSEILRFANRICHWGN